MNINGPLIDCHGRVHTELRVSVTDRCNLRCDYCMPPEGVQFRPHTEILTYEEIERFVRVAARLGVRKVRITGGEPLVRKDIVSSSLWRGHTGPIRARPTPRHVVAKAETVRRGNEP